MYIRQTSIKNTASGEAYSTFRLVRSERVQGKVRQVTLLNLGRNFPVAKEDWPRLCLRIEEVLSGQTLAFSDLPASLEKEAQRYAARLLVREEAPRGTQTASPEASSYAEVDTESLQMLQPRSVGVEHVGVWALSRMGLLEVMKSWGLTGPAQAALVGSIVGRMAQPGSELSTWNWLTRQSALGELIDMDYARLSLSSLYRASDMLMRHRDEIEAQVFEAARSQGLVEETITLFDLTNTYFEGEAAGQEKAALGRSKEKRSDCPLITLGLVLDSSGFVRRSQTFAGNVVESGTLEVMLKGLQAPAGALVILDAGIATEATLTWLREQGYRYLAVRRGGKRQFDTQAATTIETASGTPLQLWREMDEQQQEIRLYCQSPGRELKESAMMKRTCEQFEAGLQKLVEGLSRPHGEKRHDQILMRIGRLKEKCRGASQHYAVQWVSSEDGKKITELTWEKVPVSGTRMTHPGVYCLRTNETHWDDETLWRTYSTLTDLEAVFRSLKSELGLRPIFHQKENRSDGHLFITVVAYQAVQWIRTCLKSQGITDSWSSLRHLLSAQRRVTSSFRQRDGRTLNVRKSTVAEPDLLAIYKALGIDPAPGGTKKLIA